MNTYDLQVPFFKPVWRRVLLIMVCLVWCIFEFLVASPFWGALFGGLGVYAYWQLFLKQWPENTDLPDDGKD